MSEVKAKRRKKKLQPRPHRETKLSRLLKENGLTQSGLRDLIYQECGGYLMGKAAISKICNGLMPDYKVTTGALIAKALGCTLDDIIDVNELVRDKIADLKTKK